MTPHSATKEAGSGENEESPPKPLVQHVLEGGPGPSPVSVIRIRLPEDVTRPLEQRAARAERNGRAARASVDSKEAPVALCSGDHARGSRPFSCSRTTRSHRRRCASRLSLTGRQVPSRAGENHRVEAYILAPREACSRRRAGLAGRWPCFNLVTRGPAFPPLRGRRTDKAAHYLIPPLRTSDKVAFTGSTAVRQDHIRQGFADTAWTRCPRSSSGGKSAADPARRLPDFSKALPQPDGLFQVPITRPGLPSGLTPHPGAVRTSREARTFLDTYLGAAGNDQGSALLWTACDPDGPAQPWQRQLERVQGYIAAARAEGRDGCPAAADVRMAWTRATSSSRPYSPASTPRT